jgi:hypothetical protein
MPPHIPPPQRPPYWTPPEHTKEDKAPPWHDVLKYTAMIAAVIIAAWLIFSVLGIMFSNFGEWAINPIRHFKHLFRRASFIPINPEFIQLMCWAVFVGWAVYRFKNMFNRRQ